MSLSSSRHIMQFCDSFGNITFKTFQDMAKVNTSSTEIEYRDYLSNDPDLHISESEYFFCFDRYRPLSSVGMPYYRESLLSVWPKNLLFKIGQPGPKILPEVLANTKMIDFVGYADKPKNLRGNQTLSISYNQKHNPPIFRSQFLKEKVFGKSVSELNVSLVIYHGPFLLILEYENITVFDCSLLSQN